MSKRGLFLCGLILLPFIGEGMTQIRNWFLAQTINSSSTVPLVLIYDAVIAVFFVFFVYWLAIRSALVNIPKMLCWALIVFGLLIVCLPFYPPIFASASSVAPYRTIGGAMWFVVGVTKALAKNAST
jgi:hypothetical protein